MQEQFSSPELLSSPATASTVDWLSDNVFHPFANGSGVIQIYDSIASKPIGTYSVPEAKVFSRDWGIQSLSSAAGAIVPLVIAGKAAGLGMRFVGEKMALEGAAARLVASESIAQMAGAGLYTFIQKPGEGQTRTGNAVGSIAGFGAFAAGNALLGKLPMSLANPLASTVASAAGRFGVGAVGGLASYESSNLMASMQGVQHERNWNERWHAMAQGGFVNVALPPMQEFSSKVIDATIYSRAASKGLPIDRQIKIDGLSDPDILALARENPLARVKRGTDTNAIARIPENAVTLSTTDGTSKLAHELKHLSLARVSEPLYREIGLLAQRDPVAAEKAFIALRANLESSARQVENRVVGRSSDASKTGANHAAEVVTDPHQLLNQIASDGKTYGAIWKSEFEAFKIDSRFRPPIENGGSRDFVKATKDYEKWMTEHLKIVPADLAKKHAAMAKDPFNFMRGTYYRWAETFPEQLPKLMKAPIVNSVGDLHVNNFGTWVDKKGRSVWGVNDFDEAYKLPYTNDLVRLVSSAKVLNEQGGLKLGLKDTAEQVLDGYRQGLNDGGKPFILAENSKLDSIASSQIPKPEKFWKHLREQAEQNPLSRAPQDALKEIGLLLPAKHGELLLGHRQAGVGSLGRERILAMTEAAKKNYAVEAKASLPSANYYLSGKQGEKSYYKEVMGNAVRSADPLVAVSDSWVTRALVPGRHKIELGDVIGSKNEARLLWAMGYETANIHLGTIGAAPAILKDLGNRNSNWLVDAAKTMKKSVLEEQAEWKKYQK